MSAALMNEMDRLRADRDEWKQQAEAEAIVSGSYRDERDAALEREQALAAHVERFRSAAKEAIENHLDLCTRIIKRESSESLDELAILIGAGATISEITEWLDIELRQRAQALK